jgi:hypothetical protein
LLISDASKIIPFSGLGANPIKIIFDSLFKKQCLMFLLADKRIPEKAKKKLDAFAETLFIESHNITYPAISGHPDIFFCQSPDTLFVAPNTPEKLKQQLRERQIDFVEGVSPIGQKFPETSAFNAVVSHDFLIHHLQYTDAAIRDACGPLESIPVKQAYTRCTLIALENRRFITSDRGIEKTLSGRGFEVLFVHPGDIILPGFAHGFIGGCCGIYEDKIFFTGSLKYFPEGEKIRNFVRDKEIVELYDGPLFDGGSLIFISLNG